MVPPQGKQQHGDEAGGDDEAALVQRSESWMDKAFTSVLDSRTLRTPVRHGLHAGKLTHASLTASQIAWRPQFQLQQN